MSWGAIGCLKDLFWDKHSLTANEESRTDPGNVIDMETYGETDKQISRLYWNTTITEDFATGAGMYLKLVTSDASDFSTGVVVVASIGDAADPYAAADWTAGKMWSIGISCRRLKKYVEVEFVETTDATAGKVTTGLSLETLPTPQNIQKFPT